MRTLLSFVPVAVCFVVGFSVAKAEDLTPPIVKQSIADITVKVGAASRFINLKKTFGLKDVTQEVVRFTTTLGPIEVELFPVSTPKTVANFLGYVDRGAGPNGGYNGSLIQNSTVTATPTVIQGGSYYIESNHLEEIDEKATIKSEAGIPNTRGTIAMVLTTGPDSATDAWYFNLADNTELDGSGDSDAFTVFGRVIENGMDTINAIAALTTYNLSSELTDAFQSVPLVQYNPSTGLMASDFVYVDKLAPIAVLPANPGGMGLLQVKLLNNTHPDLVTVTFTGQKLKLTFHGKQTGMAKITLKAVDTAGEKVKTSFTVKVEE